MSWVRGIDGCWHQVRPATVARWRLWRLLHPAWHAPARLAVEAGIACGAPAALALALAAAPPEEHARGGGLAVVQPFTPPEGPRAVGGTIDQAFARGGALARFTSAPPGGSRAVGGAVPDVSELDPSGTSGGAAFQPVAVPEPGTLALLGLGASAAISAKRRSRLRLTARCGVLAIWTRKC